MSITREQAREIDRRATAEYHIPSLILMENAARGVADTATDLLHSLLHRPTGKILILCGGGNNGGDGLAAARHLHNRRNLVHVGLTVDPVKYQGDALTHWQIIQAMRLPAFTATPDAVRAFQADLIIDAIFGTGLTAPPRPPFADLVAAIESTRIPVLAVDLPSGLDCNTGQPLGATIHAYHTITFVAAKQGFASPEARTYVGGVTIADIGCPRALTG